MGVIQGDKCRYLIGPSVCLGSNEAQTQFCFLVSSSPALNFLSPSVSCVRVSGSLFFSEVFQT